jgi:uncharacterized protein YqgC (DUF456 family)
MLEILLIAFVSVLAVSAWAAGILGLPGNWIMVALAIGGWGLARPESALAVGTPVLVSLIVLATLGEVVEFLAGALGVKKLGGSTRSTWFALLGSLVGALAGFVVGSGIPVIGNIIASVLGSALGALVGTLYAERTEGKAWEHSLQVGSAAFIGRILGTMAKLTLGTAMLIIFLAAIWL